MLLQTRNLWLQRGRKTFCLLKKNTKKTAGWVSVYKQIVGLYVIENLIFLLIPRKHQQVQLIDCTI